MRGWGQRRVLGQPRPPQQCAITLAYVPRLRPCPVPTKPFAARSEVLCASITEMRRLQPTLRTSGEARVPCAILISEEFCVFGHFHAHWQEPVNRDMRSMHAGVGKVTESSFSIDVQREMRLRTKGGAVSWGSAVHQDSAALDGPCRGTVIAVLVGHPTCDVT